MGVEAELQAGDHGEEHEEADDDGPTSVTGDTWRTGVRSTPLIHGGAS